MLWPEHLASCPRGNLLANVGDGSKVDVSECPADVRFTPKSGHRNSVMRCPLCAKSGHLVLGRRQSSTDNGRTHVRFGQKQTSAHLGGMSALPRKQTLIDRC